MRGMLLALLQEETTGGLADAAQDLTTQGKQDLGPVAQFFEDIYEYLTSTEFVGNVIASVLVVIMGSSSTGS